MPKDLIVLYAPGAQLCIRLNFCQYVQNHLHSIEIFLEKTSAHLRTTNRQPRFIIVEGKNIRKKNRVTVSISKVVPARGIKV
jgi:hypothetical protein